MSLVDHHESFCDSRNVQRRSSLENMQHEIILDENIRIQALKPLNRMLEIV